MYGLPTEIVGQSRYKEHIQAIRNNSGNSGYLNRVLNTGHANGSITDTVSHKNSEKLKTSKHIRKISYI
jgi:hypothetical protein